MLQKMNLRAIMGSMAAMFVAIGLAMSPAQAQSGQPIKIGFSMALTGPLRAPARARCSAMKIWEEDINAKGGMLGRPVQLVYYDDQSAPARSARHLHQADRHRQSRPDHRALRDHADRAGDAGGDAEEQAVHRPVRHGGELGVQIQPLLLDDPDRSEPEARLHQGLLRTRHGAEPEAADDRDRGGRRRVRAQRLDGARENCKAAGLQDRVRPHLSAVDRRTSRRSCARSRRPIPTSSWSAPTRSTRWAWCARSTRSASSRR